MATALKEIEEQAQESSLRYQKSNAVVVERALEIVVTDSQSYANAAQFLLDIKDKRKFLDNEFEDSITAAHEAHKKVLALKRKATDGLDEAERIVKPKIATYLAEEEKKRRDEEARLQAEAQKRAETEALELAAAAEKAGDHAEAEAIINDPVVAPVLVLQPTTPKVSGIAMRKKWTFRIVNAALLPREYLTPDEQAIRKVVEALKDKANIPGVRVFCEDVVAAGRRS